MYEYSAGEHRDLAKLAYDEAIDTWKRAMQYRKKMRFINGDGENVENEETQTKNSEENCQSVSRV